MNEVVQNALIMGVLLAVVVIPIVIVNKQAKAKQKQKLKLRLQQIADENHLNISKFDFFGTKVIALDKERKCLLYFDNLSAEPALLYDLNKAKTAGIEKSLSGDIIKEVQLVLKGTDHAAGLSISFYRSPQDNEMQRKQLISKAEAWHQTLSEII